MVTSSPQTASRNLQPRRGRHIPELDGVRGLAIAGVMALHFITNTITPTNLVERTASKLATYGVWGVDLFFVLSGFLITGILLDSKGSHGYFRNFFVRRTLRIFPLYYGVLLLLFVIIPASTLQVFDPELVEMRSVQRWIWPYLTNVYLGGQPDFTIPYLSHFWSLAIEEHFYLVWPFVIFALSRRSAMWVCAAIGLLAFALRLAFAIATPDLLYSSVLTPCRLDTLCAGGWFALAAHGEGRLTHARALRGLAWAGAGVFALSAWNATLASGAPYVLTLRTSLLAVFFGFFVYTAAHHPGLPVLKSSLRAGWLRTLGKYSYGLYVFHGIVAYAMHRRSPAPFLNDLVPVHTLAALLQIGISVALSLGLAVLSFELFESRFLTLKKLFEYGDRSAAAPAAEQQATA